MSATDLAVGTIVALAGLVRGVTGFGGAMFMAPPLSLLVGPVHAVIYALALEAAAALNMLPAVWKYLDRRTLALVGIPALITVPVGGFLLTSLPPEMLRRFIAVTVIVFSIAMLAGFRYTGRPRVTTSAFLGGLSGVLFGATSMGGPPVILYLLSGPDAPAITRANLVAYISIISALALLFPWIKGVLSGQVALNAVLLVVPYLVGTWLGSQLFSRLSEKTFRRLALCFMLTVGVASLIA